ncbi:hypothetical protein ANN_23868 [Periplaneta americana]|uniref:Uncharacterized protein n=1 Tax=Periplaneta americana TaxID=6978 RepID=A0ABQ8S1S8_PERAM|nr:hypothetical protein ANN_23868 [Periplaneta americana]
MRPPILLETLVFVVVHGFERDIATIRHSQVRDWSLTPVSERVGVGGSRKQEKYTTIIASHNVLYGQVVIEFVADKAGVSEIFTPVSLYHSTNTLHLLISSITCSSKIGWVEVLGAVRVSNADAGRAWVSRPWSLSGYLPTKRDLALSEIEAGWSTCQRRVHEYHLSDLDNHGIYRRRWIAVMVDIRSGLCKETLVMFWVTLILLVTYGTTQQLRGHRTDPKVKQFKYLGATVTNINDTREEIKRRINMGDACYYSVEKLLSSSLLSKNLKVRIYKTVILPVVLYGCETWTLTLREEQKLRVFENKVLGKIFRAKRDEDIGEWRKLHNTELHALYSSPDIIRNIKSRRLRWAGHVARMGESRNAYRVLEPIAGLCEGGNEPPGSLKATSIIIIIIIIIWGLTLRVLFIDISLARAMSVLN